MLEKEIKPVSGFDESNELSFIPGISIQGQRLPNKFVLSAFFQLASQWFFLASECHLLAKTNITNKKFIDAQVHSLTVIYACNQGLNFLYDSPARSWVLSSSSSSASQSSSSSASCTWEIQSFN